MINKQLQYRVYKESLKAGKMNSLSRVEKDKFINEKLKLTLKYAIENSEFYRKKFSGIDILSIDINNLKTLPITTKEELRLNYNNNLTRKLKKSDYICCSGGTTGTPFRYALSKKQYCTERGLQLWAWYLAGFKVGDRVGYLDNVALKGRFIKLKNYLRRIYPRSMYEVNKNTIIQFLKYWESNGIKWLRIVPSSMFDFVKLANAIGYDSFTIGTLKGLFSTGEMLYDFQRKEIEKFFGVHIFDQYGMGDGGFAAAQTLEDGKLFRCDETRSVIEIVDEKVILTLIDDEPLFPFIRYEVGDMAEFNDPLYVNGNLMLKKVIGRTFQSIILKNGDYVQGLYFVHVFDEVADYIERFKITQENMDDLLVQVEIKDRTNENLIENKILNKLAPKIKANLNIKFEFVDKIHNSKKKFIYIERKF